MGNTAYLCCSDDERVQPSLEAGYRPEVHTLAGARQVVPVLWLALFEPDDLRTAVLVDEDGGELTECAPLTRRSVALGRLDGAAARIEKAYPRIGPLAAHVAPFRDLLASAAGEYSTGFATMANRLLKPIEYVYQPQEPKSPAPAPPKSHTDNGSVRNRRRTRKKEKSWQVIIWH